MNEIWKKPPITLEAYQAMVGKEIGVSSWHLIDQSRIDTYADVTEDHQFIHVDPERAKATPFGTTIAHGFLTMSMLSVMSYEVMPAIAGTTMGVNYGFDKLRFISPVRSGKRVRGRFVLAEARLRKAGELQSRTNVTVEIEGEDKPALVADWLGLIYIA
ncbi:MaoC family dehydratase [Bradyrhizobium sp. INPA01-394B]|uniref:MaoC family dehydratase n=1 Tax=Bradyrhizobium campsiandrae TaxID=1729892 RepID=A0ABR7UJ48_9BRAD|nr:MaoC family dehydratase [Bradyrhizobium campsiandrae]MBC9882479.1 MaoC family dehydratase [Bradyrhizobium campsiandrae]MBC9983489.1 MaoC family dehydratase [Bradyrhizobium campsiandrae]